MIDGFYARRISFYRYVQTRATEHYCVQSSRFLVLWTALKSHDGSRVEATNLDGL